MDKYQMRYDTVSQSDAGSLPATNNANSILTLNTHPGNYNFQLGFSSGEEIYMRSFQNQEMNASREWNKMIHSGNINQYLPSLDDYHKLYEFSIDLTASTYDQNTFYPCVSYGAMEKIYRRFIVSNYLEGAAPTWGGTT